MASVRIIQFKNSPELFIGYVRRIDQYSNMAPRLSGQTSIFGVVFFVFKSLLGIERIYPKTSG